MNQNKDVIQDIDYIIEQLKLLKEAGVKSLITGTVIDAITYAPTLIIKMPLSAADAVKTDETTEQS